MSVSASNVSHATVYIQDVTTRAALLGVCPLHKPAGETTLGLKERCKKLIVAVCQMSSLHMTSIFLVFEPGAGGSPGNVLVALDCIVLYCTVVCFVFEYTRSKPKYFLQHRIVPHYSVPYPDMHLAI